MPYEVLATSKTPALIIYLLDVSASMSQPLGDRRRIDVVGDALQAALRTMVFRSTKGSRLSPRYRIAMIAYSDHVYDLLDGIKAVDQVVKVDLHIPGCPPPADALWYAITELLAGRTPVLTDDLLTYD